MVRDEAVKHEASKLLPGIRPKLHPATWCLVNAASTRRMHKERPLQALSELAMMIFGTPFWC